MTKFEDFLNQTSKEVAEEMGVTIYGGFACEICHFQCDEAEWFPSKKTLEWKCPDGHPNKIKDFKGF